MTPKGICQKVYIPSVCEAGGAEVVDEHDWAFLLAFTSKKEQKRKAWHVAPNLSTKCVIVEIISNADDWAFLPAFHKKKKKRKKQKGSFIWNYIALKHDTKLVLT